MTLLGFAYDCVVGAAQGLTTPTGTLSKHNLDPAYLESLDRALTPIEQKIVDDYQIAKANAAQQHEESTPYRNPETGRVARLQPAEYVPGDHIKITKLPTYTITKIDEPAAAVKHHLEWWQIALLALGAVGLGVGGYELLSKGRR